MKALYLSDDYLLKSAFTPKIQEGIKKLVHLDIKSKDEIKALSEEEYTNLLHQYEILIGGWGSRILPENYHPIPNQYYCCLTGNFDHKVLPIHAERGLKLTNWGNVISHTIAESALMMILGCLRRSGVVYDRIHVQKAWTDKAIPTPESLFNRKVGFLGFGLIAQELAKLLQPFQTELFAYDPYQSQEVLDTFQVQRLNSVSELFQSVHIVSNHLAKTPQTNDLVNAEVLALLPETGVFVNTARGNSVDEDALADEHEKGRLFSALDVYKTEPLPANHRLREQPRCLLFPHQAGPTLDQYWRMGEHAIKNIKNYIEGKPLILEISAEKMRIMT